MRRVSVVPPLRRTLRQAAWRACHEHDRAGAATAAPAPAAAAAAAPPPMTPSQSPCSSAELAARYDRRRLATHRELDWDCPACGAFNFADRVNCRECEGDEPPEVARRRSAFMDALKQRSAEHQQQPPLPVASGMPLQLHVPPVPEDPDFHFGTITVERSRGRGRGGGGGGYRGRGGHRGQGGGTSAPAEARGPTPQRAIPPPERSHSQPQPRTWQPTPAPKIVAPSAVKKFTLKK